MDRRLLIVLAVVLVVAGFALTNALFIVDQTEQALVLQFGQPRRVIRTPGLWAKRPFLEDVKRYDNRLLDFEPPPEEVIVSDQKRLVVDTYTRYRIIDPLLFYQTVNSEAAVRARLSAMVNGSMVTAQKRPTPTIVGRHPRVAVKCWRIGGQTVPANVSHIGQGVANFDMNGKPGTCGSAVKEVLPWSPTFSLSTTTQSSATRPGRCWRRHPTSRRWVRRPPASRGRYCRRLAGRAGAGNNSGAGSCQ